MLIMKCIIGMHLIQVRNLNNIIPAPQEASAETLRPGARKVVDLNGDGAITTADLYYAGDMAPRLTFGIKAGLEWKGI